MMAANVILGYIVAGLCLLLTALSMGFGAVWNRYQNYKSCSEAMTKTIKTMVGAAMEKEKRITVLKQEVSGLELLVKLKDEELNELEGREAERSRGREETPEWYKAEYLKLLQDVKNEETLRLLLEQANGKLSADLSIRDRELHELTERMKGLRDEYEAYQLEFGALHVADISDARSNNETKPEPDIEEIGVFASQEPAECLQEAVSSC
jgi:hypothetical protein